jgi:hypothetical protein
MKQNTAKKIRQTFTLSRESMDFVAKVRRETKAASNSAVVDELLLKQSRQREKARTEAAIGNYYDQLSSETAEENEAWARIAEFQFPLE